MATTCDYCGNAIAATDARVTMVPPPDPTNPAPTESWDFHVECQRQFLKQAAGKVKGNRPAPPPARP